MCADEQNMTPEEGIESIKGDEVMDSLGAIDADCPNYEEEDDVANAIARGDY